MAQPIVLSFGKGLFFLGDGAAVDEVFQKICGFNSMGLQIQKDTNDVTIPDCDNPDDPAWKATDVLSLSWSMNFEGVMAKEAEPLLWAATNRGVSTNVRQRLLTFGTGAGTPDLEFSGKGHVSHEITGQRGNKWEVKVTIVGDGALARASVAALVP
ncbi:hypothetical protein GGC47_003175 [Bosea sp. OAE752]|uniref:phage tail tube protein n=1 Tax=Bosea sp. OAE752 TaxID=2663873 RepID=UPI003D1E8C59